MERIKKALDKAQAERASLAGQAQPLSISDNTGARIEDAPIQYSQTKIHKIDSKHLHSNRIVIDESNRIGLTAYKMLRTQVLQRMVAKGWNALAITSPGPGDGKTVTAINLAISLARELHHTVLLVDLDLRNPSIHKYFGIEPERGIGDYLLIGVPMGDVLINPGIERLVVLPGREPIENSSEILASPAMGNLVRELKTRYPARFVLFDLPPILSADDALSFAPFVDAFLLVIRDAKTTRQEIEHTMEILQGVPIIGTVLNGSDEKITPYY